MIIYFAKAHSDNVCKCYLGDKLCCALKGIPEFQSNYQQVLEGCGQLIAAGAKNIDRCIDKPPNEKLVYLKAQLGVAAGMLATCAIYVVLFLFACFGVCFGHD